MILLEALTKAGFKKSLFDKTGSIYVEASIVMPVTCLIIIGMIGLIMTFYSSVHKQAEEHIEIVSGWDCSEQIEVIRRFDRFIDWI